MIVVDDAASRSIALANEFPAAKIVLGAGNDFLSANNQPNTIYGGSGDDTIYAGAGDDVVYGEAGIDRLYGEAGADYLDGGTNKDCLNGGSGINRLVGGAGIDNLTVRVSKDKTDRDPKDHIKLLT